MEARLTAPLRWGADGLIPVVTIDDATGSVLMLAFMNQQALAATRNTGEVHYWSRSRNTLWHKGATSGHIQELVSIHVNCDQNSLLLRVNQTGAVCHEGFETCYFRRLEPDNSLVTTRDRLVDPAEMYGTSSVSSGERRNVKVPEETTATDDLVPPRESSDVDPAASSGRLWLTENRAFARDMSHHATRLLVGAYRVLNDPALVSLSGTARRLQGPGDANLLRLADELDELAGVLDGTHGHGSERSDVILEGSQCLYWSLLPLVQAGYGVDDLPIDLWLEGGEALVARPVIASQLRVFADAWRDDSPTPQTLLERTRAVYPLLAAACTLAGIEPATLIAHDLTALRVKPYLARYFEQNEPRVLTAMAPE